MANEVTVSDRCVILASADLFEEFISDPEGFLRKIGALDGIPQFNGVKRDNGDRDLQPVLQAMKTKGHRVMFTHVFGPVPDFCEWNISLVL